MQIIYLCLLTIIVPILSNQLCDHQYQICLEDGNSTSCECLKNYSYCLTWNPDCDHEDQAYLGSMCENSGCTFMNCNQPSHAPPPPDCDFCQNQFTFCVNQTYLNSSSTMSPINRTCQCLTSLTQCLSFLNCTPPSFLSYTCSTFGSLCARDFSNSSTNSSFKCGEFDYIYVPPSVQQIKQYFENRLDELEEYWKNIIVGLDSITIQNIQDDTNGSCSIGLNFNYHNGSSVDTILNDIKNDISNCTGIEKDRISSVVNYNSKRAILGTADGTISVSVNGNHSGATELYSSLIFLLGSLLMLRALSQ